MFTFALLEDEGATMKLTVFFERDNRTDKIDFSGKNVEELLKALKVNPETVIVVQENEVLTEEDELKPKQKIELLSIISGG